MESPNTPGQPLVDSGIARLPLFNPETARGNGILEFPLSARTHWESGLLIGACFPNMDSAPKGGKRKHR